MHNEPNLKEIQKEWHGSLKAYAFGFIASLILTSISFLLVLTKIIRGPGLVISLVALALTQAIIQLFFFLHLGQEAKPRWETVIFLFMILVLVIIAGGSLWVMHNLNDRLMSFM